MHWLSLTRNRAFPPGIRKSIMVSTTNATLLCAAVYADTVEGTCPPPGGQPTSQVYSSFCLLYDPLTNSILSTKVVFLAGSVAVSCDYSTDYQLYDKQI